MNRTVIFFFLLNLPFVAIYCQEIKPSTDILKIAENKAKLWERAFISKNKNYDIGNNYDLKYYRIFWEIDPAVLYISGNVTSYFVITEDNTQFIKFELSSELTVDSVKYHSSHVTFTHISETIEINLETQIPVNTFDSVTIWYQGVPESAGGFSSFTVSEHNGIPIMWTLSQPYGSSDWWPCKNVLNDKIDSVDIIISTPSQYRAASNGLLISEQTVGANTFYYWKHRYPIETYLIAVAITNYVVYSDYVNLSTGGLEILNYVYPEDSLEIVSLSPQVIPSFILFDSLAGPYPFYLEKYGHVQFGWSGAMEHQIMSFMGSFGHEIIAHELIHSWFGNAITCGSWQDIWLNEGFATYFTGLTYENFFGGAYWPVWKQQSGNYITSEPWGSVWCDDTTNIWRIFNGRLSYYKGAYLLHMLRWVMGDAGFFQTIKNYILDTNLRYAYARTSDFIAHAEAVYGQSLDWFFNQWFWGQGHPSYTVYGTKLQNNQIQINITQTQSHPSVVFFKMPVPIKFSSGSQDTIVVFEHNYNNQEYLIQLHFEPLYMTFDPDLWLLSRNNHTYLGIEPHADTPEIHIMPNPANNKLSIKTGNVKFTSYDIFDLHGKLVSSDKFSETNEKTIHIEFLSAGAYLIYLKGKNFSFTAKFQKI